MAHPKIDFWYSIGSTYTYLTVMRLDGVVKSEGVTFNWCPFNVRHVMVEQNNVPFMNKPIKEAYMWRDVERRSQSYGLSPIIPAPYPAPKMVLANQIAMVASKEGWCELYTKATYKRWFEHGEAPGDKQNLDNSLLAAGQDKDRVIELATSQEIISRLEQQTQHAIDLGVFGSPSFVIDGEVFWGDDRLTDAIRWVKQT